MKRPMENALWCDLETDEERASFIRSGRGFALGYVDKMLTDDVSQAFEDAAKWRAHAADFAMKYNAETRQFSLTAVTGRLHPQKPAPPWGADAVPLMVCPKNDKTLCDGCTHDHPHEREVLCDMPMACCPPCVQVGWRERSKP